MAASILLIDFLADGRCVVSREQATATIVSRSDATVERPGTVAAGDYSGTTSRAVVPSNHIAGAAFRCPVPYVEFGSNAIELRVVLPPSMEPPADTFPQLAWHTAGARWIGSASLPSAPAFISLGREATFSGEVSLGWNFYGFFVFAAAFIAIYFGWARSMRDRERRRQARA